MRRTRDSAHELESSWPTFLDYLDDNPAKALEGLHNFTWRLCQARPPSILRSLSKTDREDRIADFVARCGEERFRKLRSYSDKGKAFAAWLTVVLDREVRTWLRAERRSQELPDSIKVEPPEPGPGPSPAVLASLHRSLGRLSDKCRLYLSCLADGMKPREITMVAGLPDEENKRVSDDLRHCIKRLRGLLLEEGVRPEEVMS